MNHSKENETIKRGIGKLDGQMIAITGRQTIYELVTRYPELKDLMVLLGFKDILKPGMLQTMGKVMTLEKGARMKSISMKEISALLAQNHFDLKVDK